MRRTRSGFSLSFIVAVVLLLASLFGPPLYVELAGHTAAGTVTDRREEIRVGYGEWTRSLSLQVRYIPADRDEPEVVRIPVSIERYDRARVGDAVRVRYMPHPEVRMIGLNAAPRLSDQGPLGQLRALLSPGLISAAFALVGLVLLVILSKTKRVWLMVLLGLGLLGLAMYTVSDPPPPAPPGPQRSTQATVRLAYEIDRLSSSSTSRRRSRLSDEALQPYTVVALEFVPQGATSSVIAVDLVDLGSVQGLEVGAELPINYSVADPRWAQITGAQRTYFWKNLYSYAFIAGLVLLVGLGFWLASRRMRTRRRQAQQP